MITSYRLPREFRAQFKFMTPVVDFTAKVEAKVTEQLNAQRVGYLLGAGTSYLNNFGYPLATQLWDRIKDRITDPTKRGDIQVKLDGGAKGMHRNSWESDAKQNCPSNLESRGLVPFLGHSESTRTRHHGKGA